MRGITTAIRTCTFAALAVLLLAGVRPATAQLSATSGSTTGSSCASSNADGFCGFARTTTINSATVFASRYAWNVNADIGALSTRDQSGTAVHNLALTATAVKGYRLDVAQSFVGDMNRNSDTLNCDGAANVSGVSGSRTGPGSLTGSLNVADPGSIGNGQSTTSVPFANSANASITDSSNGTPKNHTLSFTWNAQVRSNSCEAAVRLGLANGSTTGCTACEYPGSPARTAASDGHVVTVTLVSLCGNGILDGGFGEQCDGGPSNGSPTSCCTSDCQFKIAGTTCRGPAGACDAVEVCTGGSGTCPANAALPNGTVCRAASSGEVCDITEFCDGTNINCPLDQVEPNGTVCRASAGACDVAETCNGVLTTCPANSFASNVTVCRGAAGVCDVAETCTGSGPNCPANAFVSSLTVCRGSGGVCDVAENCPGNAANCPADSFQPNTTVCRGSAGTCDVAETCTGGGAACPGDAKSSAVCRAAAGTCDVAESCDGVGNNCPSDTLVSGGTECRAVAGVCDVAEQCDGSNPACPTDAFEPSSVECRASAGVCDTAENCSGAAAACPSDAKSTAECRASAGACDVAELCDGSGDDCPADAIAPNTTVCRPSAGACDVADTCDGVNIACPADTLEPDNTPCDDGLFCNGAETCQSGSCTDSADPCGVFCNEGTDTCQLGGCPATPQAGCRTAQKSLLLFKNKADNSKDKMIWKWIKGQSTSQADFANPTATADYALCVYSYAGTTAALVAQVEVPPSGTKWSALSTKGFKYFDAAASEDGAQKISLKGSSTNKAKALVKGRGADLPDPIDGPALTFPVVAQLINYDTAICWEGTYTSALKNDSSIFKAKQ